MAWTQADLDSLEEAMKAGVLKVRYSDGKEVTYRSLAEMMQLRQLMQKQIAPASGNSRITLTSYCPL